MLTGKNIIVGVCGSVAAYKTASLVSALVQRKASVTVVMTPAATQFITPLTFTALCGNPTLTEILSADYDHLRLAEKADLYVIAPATANTMAKITAGVADNLVTALALTQKVPLLICPAMNEKMWQAPATQQNLKLLQNQGAHILEPNFGYLACGEEGKGRLAEPEVILAQIEQLLKVKEQLSGRKILITGGATREYIDAVRFISNPASGLTGYYLAAEAAKRGAQVFLVTGATTVNLTLPPNVTVFSVVTATEMEQKVTQLFKEVDAVVMAAAVSDFIPVATAAGKVKKEQLKEVKLKPAPDILKALGKQKKDKFLVGFAAQTSDWLKAGAEKLKEKNLDLIVVTDVSKGKGFGQEQIKAWFVYPQEKAKALGLIPKKQLATIVMDAVADRLLSSN